MDTFDWMAQKLQLFLLGLGENDWIQWITQENDFYDDCDKFNNCYFICKKMPKYIQHPNCKCNLKKIAKPIPNKTAFANCDIRKFTEYVFSLENNKGKLAIFKSMGFTIEDSDYLKKLYITQALEKYCNGEYTYKGTNIIYPKIEIIIDVVNKKGLTKHVKSGWILKPNGEIILTTPYSGEIK